MCQTDSELFRPASSAADLQRQLDAVTRERDQYRDACEHYKQACAQYQRVCELADVLINHERQVVRDEN